MEGEGIASSISVGVGSAAGSQIAVLAVALSHPGISAGKSRRSISDSRRLFG
jgi:hypothetical protein